MLYKGEFKATADPTSLMYDPTITEVFEAKAFVGLNVSETALNFNSTNSSLASLPFLY